MVWVSGTFGKLNPPLSRINGTWVAEVKSNDEPGVAIPEQPANNIDASAFPNPAHEMVNVVFTLQEPKALNFELYDLNGKLVKLLFREKAKQGENQFSFSTAPLAGGIYLLTIKEGGEVLESKRIVVQ